MLLFPLVLFRKNLFEPMCLAVSDRLIRGGRRMTDDELLTASVAPEGAHFLETSGLLISRLTLAYCHCFHLLNCSDLIHLPTSQLKASCRLLKGIWKRPLRRRTCWLEKGKEWRRRLPEFRSPTSQIFSEARTPYCLRTCCSNRLSRLCVRSGMLNTRRSPNPPSQPPRIRTTGSGGWRQVSRSGYPALQMLGLVSYPGSPERKAPTLPSG